MASSQESNPTTNSAPPVAESPTVTGVPSTNSLGTATQCRFKCDTFYDSPASECRCWCSDCHADPKTAALDATVSSNTAEESVVKSDAADEHNGPVFKAESLPVAKRARIEEVVANDAFQPTIKKQKKMKFSSILKGMMLGNSKPLVAEEEREALRRGLGGGDFEKVAKI